MRYVEGTDLAGLVAENGALERRRALDLLTACLADDVEPRALVQDKARLVVGICGRFVF